MKRKILILDNVVKKYVDIFSKEFEADIYVKNKIKNFNFYEVIIVGGGYKLRKNFLEKFTNLKLISIFGVGYDGIDIKHCRNRNLTICNTPNVLTNDVADMAMTLLLNLSREIVKGNDYVLKGKWKKTNFNLTNSIFNKKVGIVGLGQIGLAFAKKAKVFGLDVFYFGPNKKKNKFKYFNKLEKMASRVDYLVLTCISNDNTKNIINKKILNVMKENSYIINVARGDVMNEEHLITALQQKKIKGAALDVFLNEPNINKEFKKLDNVLLSPHNASGTHETRYAMAKLCNENIKNFFNKKKYFRVL